MHLQRNVFRSASPQEAEVVSFSEGSHDPMGIFLDGDLLATITNPWAYDALRQPVPTSLAIEDGALIQRVGHNFDTVFPITADPQIDWGWQKTKTQATGAAGGAGATGPIGMAILAAAGKLGYDAIQAHRHGKCLGIVVNTNLASSNGGISTSEYSCP